MKKGFLIELDDYPNSAEKICREVEKYCATCGEKLSFANRAESEVFFLDGVPYRAEITMIRGGYGLHCKEI